MTSTDIDAARLTLALNELRLPAIKALWPRCAEQADKEGWRAARLLSALVEHVDALMALCDRLEAALAQAHTTPPRSSAATPKAARLGCITLGARAAPHLHQRQPLLFRKPTRRAVCRGLVL